MNTFRSYVQAFIIVMSIAILSCSGCTTKLKHTPSGQQFYNTPNPIKIGVLTLNNKTNNDYLQLWTAPPWGFEKEPHRSLTNIITEELKSVGVFSRVQLVDIPSSSFMQNIKRLRNEHDLDAVLVGNLYEYKAGWAPHAFAFILPSSLGGAVGIPIVPNYWESHIKYDLRLVDIKNRKILWSSGNNKVSMDVELYFTSYTTDPGYWRKNNRALVDKFVDEVCNQLVEASKQDRIMARYQGESKTEDSQPDYASRDQEVQENQSNISGLDSAWRAPSQTRLVSVGISEFNDNAIPQVNYAVKDAKYFSSFLQSSGVPEKNITCLTNNNATRSNILDSLMNLKMATTDRSETAIFYFSGHGAPVLKEGKIVDTSLVPYDATEDSIRYSGIKVSTLKNMLSNTNGNWIVILDACFSGKEGRSVLPKDVKSISVVPKDLDVTPKKENNFWWLTSTSGDKYANAFPKENHGLFTHYFIQALKGERGVDANEDGLISLKEAFEWAEAKVSSVSRKSLGRPQDPELNGKDSIVLTIPE